MKALTAVLMLALSTSASAETIQGRWKLVAAEDMRADGSVARYPWGMHPVGSIVVEGGSCYLQIMSVGRSADLHRGRHDGDGADEGRAPEHLHRVLRTVHDQ